MLFSQVCCLKTQAETNKVSKQFSLATKTPWLGFGKDCGLDKTNLFTILPLCGSEDGSDHILALLNTFYSRSLYPTTHGSSFAVVSYTQQQH